VHAGGATAKGTQAALLQVKERRAALAQWQRATAKLREGVLQDPAFKDLMKSGGMDDFIRAQERSDDKCHAKQLEAKRSLDGLLHSVKQLSAEIEAETSVVTGNTETLEDALSKKKNGEDKKTSCEEECTKKKAEDEKTELGKIHEELEEMKNIANPDVRSHVKFDVDYEEAAKTAAEAARKKGAAAAAGMTAAEQAKVIKDAGVAMLQTTWRAQTEHLIANLALVVTDAGRCQAFANVVNRVEGQYQLGLARGDCEDARAELQKEFTKAFLAIADMYDKKAQEIKDEAETCANACTDTFEAVDESVKDQISTATQNIAKAKDTLEDLEPMLEEAKKSLEKLRAHVATLEGTCKTGTNVSEHLKKIRNLIKSLEECPGKNDFSLDIPEWAPKTPSLLKTVERSEHHLHTWGTGTSAV